MIIGIDPGMSGAIVVRSQGWTRIYDIPTVKTATVSGNNKKQQNDYDLQGLQKIVSSIVKNWKDKDKAIIVCEYSAGMAFKRTKFRGEHFDDSKTAWKKGYGFGIIRALFACYGLDFTFTPRPGDWKRRLKLTDSSLTYEQKKEKARLMAIELFPVLEKYLKRKKDADRAEALLLTVWAERKAK